jgi:diacylglycerol kinase (ATP)
MTAKVILNPYSGRWKALERFPEAEVALKAAGVIYNAVQSESPGHGILLAEEAFLEGYSPIICAGGDGSIGDVVNGIMSGARRKGMDVPDIPLGILPLGTANDLVDNLGLPRNLPSAARVIADGKTRKIDLCQADIGKGQMVRYFVNNSAIGLEPTITLIQQGIQRLRGIFRYLVAALVGIARNPRWSIDMEWEGGEYHGPANLVTIGNYPRTGGIFYMTPHADPSDGLLTFVYGYMRTRMQILQLLPRTMKPGPGNFVEHPAIHEIHSTWLRIHAEPPTPIHTDGEIQAKSIQDVEYRVLPARLPIIAGD